LTGPEVVARIEGSALSPTGARDERTGAGIIDTYRALSDVGPAAAVNPDAAPGTAVRVLPVPQEPPPLAGIGMIAVVGMGILLAVAGVAALFGGVWRRRGDPPRLAASRAADPVREDLLGS